MEKFQNPTEVGERVVDFFEYLLPRLFPSCKLSVLFLLGTKSRHKDSTHPDIVAPLHQLEREISLLLGQTDPNVTVHHETCEMLNGNQLEMVVELYHDEGTRPSSSGFQDHC